MKQGTRKIIKMILMTHITPLPSHVEFLSTCIPNLNNEKLFQTKEGALYTYRWFKTLD